VDIDHCAAVTANFQCNSRVSGIGASRLVMRKVSTGFSLAIEYHREADGRWLADIEALPGVTAYGRTRKQATVAVQALALRLIADRLEHGEAIPGPMNVSFIAA
jgi:predicted RNase H-like HicB family nuclease